MKFKGLIPVTVSALLSISPIVKADSDKELSIYLTREFSKPNYELGFFYSPIVNEELKLGGHISGRLEGSLPFTAKVMLGVGVGLENKLDFFCVGGKIQGYLSHGGEVDTNNDGRIDNSAGIGIGRVFQIYGVKDLYKHLGLLVAFSNKYMNFNSNFRDFPDLPLNENVIEIGLRLSD